MTDAPATADATGPSGDHVDRVIAQWAAVRPDLDLAPVGVALRLERAATHLQHAVDRVFDAAGVHRSGFAVLANLRRIGPPFQLSPSELRSNLLSSWGATVNRLDRLEESGLVRRLPDPDDRRATLIELTPAGLELTDRVVEQHLANEAALLAPLSPLQVDHLVDALRTLLAAWEGPAEDQEQRRPADQDQPPDQHRPADQHRLGDHDRLGEGASS